MPQDKTMCCPNCKKPYEWVKDKYYSARIVHRNSLCPYRFDFAHHTKGLVMLVVCEFLNQKFPWFDADRACGRVCGRD